MRAVRQAAQLEIQIEGPQPSQYAEIFSRCCGERGIEFQQGAVDHIYRRWYEGRGIHPRACHPRDLLRILVGFARYHNVAPTFTPEMVDRACQVYFAVF